MESLFYYLFKFFPSLTSHASRGADRAARESTGFEKYVESRKNSSKEFRDELEHANEQLQAGREFDDL